MDEPWFNLKVIWIESFQSWEYIVHQLKSDSGRQGEGPIIRKMYLIAEMFPSKNTSRKILTLLSEYNFEQVKRVSVAAAKFYVWVRNGDSSKEIIWKD